MNKTTFGAAVALMFAAPILGAQQQYGRDSDVWRWDGRVDAGKWMHVFNVNGSVETGIGNLANLALAAAAPAVVLSCVVPVSTPANAQTGQLAGIYYKDDLIAEPMQIADGAIVLPNGIGMGIAADEAKIRRYTVNAKL